MCIIRLEDNHCDQCGTHALYMYMHIVHVRKTFHAVFDKAESFLRVVIEKNNDRKKKQQPGSAIVEKVMAEI